MSSVNQRTKHILSTGNLNKEKMQKTFLTRKK